MGRYAKTVGSCHDVCTHNEKKCNESLEVLLHRDRDGYRRDPKGTREMESELCCDKKKVQVERDR
jgi:hypothetical protein